MLVMVLNPGGNELVTKELDNGFVRHRSLFANRVVERAAGPDV